jgi:ubiquinone/menaquinone biosynthesis C-methylase UbiE
MAADGVNQGAAGAAADVNAAFSGAGMADVYRSGGTTRERSLGPATELMLDLANLAPGSRVLDIGAGTGEEALLAARRVGAEGQVLATDPVPSMLEIAAQAARQAGLSNVVTQVADAQNLELESDSFDAVISRLVIMLVPDQAKALAEIRRVLKPGGRLAMMVWSTAERNLGGVVPSMIARRHAGLPPLSTTAVPGMFSLSQPGRLERTLGEAGFRDPTVHAVPAPLRFPSLQEWMRFQTESRPTFQDLLSNLDEAGKAAVLTEMAETMRQFEGVDGFSVYGEVLIGAGTK